MKRLAFALAAALVLPTWALSADYLYAPQLALDGGYECLLLVSNNGSTAFGGRAYPMAGNSNRQGAIRVNGQPLVSSGLAADVNLIFRIDVPAQSTRKYVLTASFFGTTIRGDLTVYPDSGSDVGSIAVAMFYNYYSTGKLVSSTGVPALVSGRDAGFKLLFPVERSASVDTGLAFGYRYADVDDYQVSKKITMTLFDQDGRKLQTVTNPGSGMFFDQIFTISLATNFMGSVLVETTGLPVLMTVLRIQNNSDGTFLLTSTPPAALP